MYASTRLAIELNFDQVQEKSLSLYRSSLIWSLTWQMVAETVALGAVLLMMRHVAFVVELRQGTARSEERRRALLAMLRLLLHDTLSPLNALSLSLEEIGDSLVDWSNFAARIRHLQRKERRQASAGFKAERRTTSSGSVQKRSFAGGSDTNRTVQSASLRNTSITEMQN